MKTRLLLFIVLLPVAALRAQKVTIVKAAGQSWSGGIAGRSGENYYFTLKFSGFSEKPQPDTLWIDQEAFPIQVDAAGQKVNATLKSNKKSYVLEISAATSKDESTRYSPVEKEPAKTSPPRNYKGVALLSYTCKGRRSYFIIPRLITQYDPISYP